ncbi:MAG: S4 domain-containing protein, partial [Bacillota bacterium]|nr:S4 domain-containing protein [Bacillota bacterium]
MQAGGQGQGERLNRYLARCGLGSRRKCEELIRTGRVRVDGEAVTHLGTTVKPGQGVTVDNALLRPEEHVYIVLHKPPGCVSTVHDPQGRPTVLDLVRPEARLFPVGRLDWDASGLLLL